MLKRGIENEVSKTKDFDHFVKILEDSFEKLRIAYGKRDSEEFNRLKRIIIQIQRKIESRLNEKSINNKKGINKQ